MSEAFISTEDVEKALHWLRDSAADIGSAKARAVKAEHMLKHIEALKFKEAEGSAEARKAHARTTDEYLDALNEDAFAAGELAKLYSLREAASMKVEAWRSQQANLRSMRT